MKIAYLITLLMTLISTPSIARDDLVTFSFNEAVEFGYKEGILDASIKYYLAGQAHSEVSKNLGQFKSNKKTNAFGKSDEKACQWVLLTALKSFQQRAVSLGANAVVNIKSNYKGREFSSTEQYQCGAGTIMAGVALKGEVVKL